MHPKTEQNRSSTLGPPHLNPFEDCFYVNNFFKVFSNSCMDFSFQTLNILSKLNITERWVGPTCILVFNNKRQCLCLLVLIKPGIIWQPWRLVKIKFNRMIASSVMLLF